MPGTRASLSQGHTGGVRERRIPNAHKRHEFAHPPSVTWLRVPADDTLTEGPNKVFDGEHICWEDVWVVGEQTIRQRRILPLDVVQVVLNLRAASTRPARRMPTEKKYSAARESSPCTARRRCAPGRPAGCPRAKYGAQGEASPAARSRIMNRPTASQGLRVRRNWPGGSTSAAPSDRKQPSVQRSPTEGEARVHLQRWRSGQTAYGEAIRMKRVVLLPDTGQSCATSTVRQRSRGMRYEYAIAVIRFDRNCLHSAATVREVTSTSIERANPVNSAHLHVLGSLRLQPAGELTARLHSRRASHRAARGAARAHDMALQG
eukprot:scaffold388_cov380-Prasinococcus_capsulatus_cf.AAC.22